MTLEELTPGAGGLGVLPDHTTFLSSLETGVLVPSSDIGRLLLHGH